MGQLHERHSNVQSTQVADLSGLNIKTIAWNPKCHSTQLVSTQNVAKLWQISNQLGKMADESSL